MANRTWEPSGGHWDGKRVSHCQRCAHEWHLLRVSDLVATVKHRCDVMVSFVSAILHATSECAGIVKNGLARLDGN